MKLKGKTPPAFRLKPMRARTSLYNEAACTTGCAVLPASLLLHQVCPIMQLFFVTSSYWLLALKMDMRSQYGTG